MKKYVCSFILFFLIISCSANSTTIEGINESDKYISSLITNGSEYYEKKEYEKAKYFLNEAINHDGASNYCCLSVAYIFLGLTYKEEGNFSEAIKAFRKGLEIKNTATFHNFIGEAYFMDGNLEEAKKHFEQSLQINPKKYMNHYYLGKIYLKYGEKEKALFEFNKVKNNCKQKKILEEINSLESSLLLTH